MHVASHTHMYAHTLYTCTHSASYLVLSLGENNWEGGNDCMYVCVCVGCGCVGVCGCGGFMGPALTKLACVLQGSSDQ